MHFLKKTHPALVPHEVVLSFIAPSDGPAVIFLRDDEGMGENGASDDEAPEIDIAATVRELGVSKDYVLEQLRDQLTPHCYKTLVLWKADKSYAEIAAAMSCPVGTVRSRLHRARKKLGELAADAAKTRASFPGRTVVEPEFEKIRAIATDNSRDENERCKAIENELDALPESIRGIELEGYWYYHLLRGHVAHVFHKDYEEAESHLRTGLACCTTPEQMAQIQNERAVVAEPLGDAERRVSLSLCAVDLNGKDPAVLLTALDATRQSRKQQLIDYIYTKIREFWISSDVTPAQRTFLRERLMKNPKFKCLRSTRQWKRLIRSLDRRPAITTLVAGAILGLMFLSGPQFLPLCSTEHPIQCESSLHPESAFLACESSLRSPVPHVSTFDVAHTRRQGSLVSDESIADRGTGSRQHA